MPKSRWTIIAALSCLTLTLACAPALAQDSGQTPSGNYSGQIGANGPGGPGGPGPMGGQRMGRPPFGPPPALGGRYKVVSGDFTALRGGKAETVKAMVRVDSQTGETWILQETSEGGRVYREWVRIGEGR